MMLCAIEMLRRDACSVASVIRLLIFRINSKQDRSVPIFMSYNCLYRLIVARSFSRIRSGYSSVENSERPRCETIDFSTRDSSEDSSQIRSDGFVHLHGIVLVSKM